MSGESKILQALHESKLEEDKWITIKGTHVQVDDNGTIKNDKLKDKIEKTSGKKVSASRKSLDGNVISVSIKNKALASAASGVGEKIKKALEKGDFSYVGWDLESAHDDEVEKIEDKYNSKVSKEAERAFSSESEVKSTFLSMGRRSADDIVKEYESSSGKKMSDADKKSIQDLVKISKKTSKSLSAHDNALVKMQQSKRGFSSRAATHNSKVADEDAKIESIKNTVNQYAESSDKEIKTYDTYLKDMTDFVNSYAKCKAFLG